MQNNVIAMEIIGKFVQKLQTITGEGRNGPWTKGSFVIETMEQFPKKVCFMAWNDKATLIDSIKENEKIKVFFDVESREFNGKWYTDLKMWKIDKQSETANNTSANEQGNDELPQETAPVFGEPSAPGEVTDDLPF